MVPDKDYWSYLSWNQSCANDLAKLEASQSFCCVVHAVCRQTTWWKLERILAFDKTKLYWNRPIDFGDACGLNSSRTMKRMIDNTRRVWQILAAIYHLCIAILCHYLRHFLLLINMYHHTNDYHHWHLSLSLSLGAKCRSSLVSILVYFFRRFSLFMWVRKVSKFSTSQMKCYFWKLIYFTVIFFIYELEAFKNSFWYFNQFY